MLGNGSILTKTNVYLSETKSVDKQAMKHIPWTKVKYSMVLCKLCSQ